MFAAQPRNLNGQANALPLSHSSHRRLQSPFCHRCSGSPPVLRTSTMSPGRGIHVFRRANRLPVLATARSGRVNIVRRELCDVESELVAADADQIAAS